MCVWNTVQGACYYAGTSIRGFPMSDCLVEGYVLYESVYSFPSNTLIRRCFPITNVLIQ